MYILGGIVLAVVFGFIALRPQTWWRATEGWTYRHPEANEPSDIAYGIQSVASIVVALACLIGGFVVQHNVSARNQRADDCATVKRIVGERTVEQVGDVRTDLRAKGFTPTDESIAETTILGVEREGAGVATAVWTSESPRANVTCA